MISKKCLDFGRNDLKAFEMPLSQTSEDSVGGVRLVSFEDSVLNFDSLAKNVCRKYRGGECCSSCDALYENNGKFYLIEFKNQGESNINKQSIKEKAFDSIGILQSTFNYCESREELARKLELIVVYNDKNEERPSFIGLKKRIKNYAKETKPLFGLDCLSPFYNEIYTVTKEEFEKDIYPKIFG